MSQSRPAARFWTAASVAMLALWASGSPTMIYPLYAHDWAMTPAATTTLFAVYPLVLVVVLLVFGDLSDHIGRRATLLAGVAAMFLGALLFAVAPAEPWLFVARAFQGVGVGLAMAPASAAMVEFNTRGGTARASSVNTAATAVGLAVATIVAGALVQYAPAPRQLSYWVVVLAAAVVFLAVRTLPRHVPDTQTSARWRPRPIRVPAGLRGVVTTSALAITTAFGVGAVLLSLGAQISADLIHSDNTLVSGLVLAITSVVIGITAIAAKRMPARLAIGLGGVASATAVALLVLSAATASLPVFAVTSVAAGVGYGLLFLGGLGLLNRHAPAHHRAGTISVVYTVAYLMQGIIAVLLGLEATAVGLQTALGVAAPVLIVLALGTSVVAALPGRGAAGAAALPAPRANP
ncbi:MFS transporter [Cryobacterium sp. SO2]|uniref:MFS transporter n=1 Tax=Cryobacterium sp. SO2 TaxID=1897060 RepID=UPI00223D8E10|nr:MFS transporter [Cryobacterium sp. SO2]WEO76340.1 MFS transporter [Cryobacterium sp. SO2]